MNSPQPKRRSIFRFSLRMGLVAITGLCLFLGLVVHKHHMNDRAFKYLDHCKAEYRYSWDEDSEVMVWLRHWVGCEKNPLGVTSIGAYAIPDMELLKRFPNLETLTLQDPLLDDFEAIGQFGKLSLFHFTPKSNSNVQVKNVAALGKLEELTELKLSSCNIGSLESLDGLTNVVSLKLSNCSLSEISSISNLRNLVFIDLSYNPIIDLGPITNCRDLKELNISGTKVADLSPLAGLTKLSDLRGNDSEISDLTPLKNLESLENLWLSNCKVTNLDGLETDSTRSCLTNLKILVLNGCPIENLTPLNKATKLFLLRVANTNVSDVSSLTNLRLHSLNVFGTKMVDLTTLPATIGKDTFCLSVGGPHLQSIHGVEQPQRDGQTAIFELDIRDAPDLTSVEPLKELKGQVVKGLHDEFRSFRLINTPVSNFEFEWLPKSTRWIYLNRSKIQNLRGIEVLTELKHIELADTPLTDFRSLAKLEFETLDVSGTEFSDLSALDGSKDSLVSLDLRNTRVTDFHRLRQFSELVSLKVSEDRLSFEQLASLRKSLPWAEVTPKRQK